MSFGRKERKKDLYFPSGSNVQTLLGKQGLTKHGGCSRRQNSFVTGVPLLSPQLFMSMRSYSMGYPFAWFTSLSWQCPLPASWLSQPAGILGGVGEAALMLCLCCSAIAKTLMWYRYVSRYKCRAQCWTGYCGESLTPSQTDPVQTNSTGGKRTYRRWGEVLEVDRFRVYAVGLETSALCRMKSAQCKNQHPLSSAWTAEV